MRILNRFLALIVSIVIAAAVVIAGIEAVLLDMGNDPLVVPRAQWDRYLSHATWGSTWIWIPALIALVVGAILVLLQLVRRRVARLRSGGVPGRELWLSRRSFAQRLSYEAERIEGVSKAKATVTARKARLKVSGSQGFGESELRQRCDELLQASLDSLNLTKLRARPTKVSIVEQRTRTTEARVQ